MALLLGVEVLVSPDSLVQYIEHMQTNAVQFPELMCNTF